MPIRRERQLEAQDLARELGTSLTRLYALMQIIGADRGRLREAIARLNDQHMAPAPPD